MSELLMLGVSHSGAGLELRERLVLPESDRKRFLEEARQLVGLREFVFLSTCNRLEFYCVAERREVLGDLADLFCNTRGVERGVFDSVARQIVGRDVTVHLAAVAAGLDSQLVGESEIFGQVKDAYAEAVRRGEAGAVLNRVFQKSFQWAKLARSETAVGEGQVSVAGVAVHLAERIFGELRGVRVLLLGAGEVAEKTARAFLSRGADEVVVANRTGERALGLAAELDVRVLPWERVFRHLGEFSVVVGSTAAMGTVVSREAVEFAMRERRAEPLFLIDLAVPRDFEPEVVSVENVFLYNLDDLARIASENQSARESELARARGLIEERAGRFWEKLRMACV